MKKGTDTLHPITPGDVLREKLVSFQREIVELKQGVREQEAAALRREQELFAELFEVLDVFDNIERNLSARTAVIDKTALALLNTMRAVQRKLLRLLGSRQIVPLEFADRRAKVGQCRILETKPDPSRKNEEILSVEKKGYIDARRGLVLRKAEVVTVCNGK